VWKNAKETVEEAKGKRLRPLNDEMKSSIQE